MQQAYQHHDAVSEIQTLLKTYTDLPVEVALSKLDRLIGRLRAAEDIEWLSPAHRAQAFLTSNTEGYKSALAALTVAQRFADITGSKHELSKIYQARSQYLSYMGLHEQAVDAMRLCIENLPLESTRDDRAWIDIYYAKLLVYVDQTDQAFELFRAAVETLECVSGRKEYAWTGLVFISMCAVEFKRIDAAITYFKQFEEFNSLAELKGSCRALYFGVKTLVLLRSGNVFEALELERLPGAEFPTPNLIRTTYLDIISAYVDAGQYVLASERIDRFFKLNADDLHEDKLSALKISYRIAEAENNKNKCRQIERQIIAAQDATETVRADFVSAIIESEIELLEVRRHLARSDAEAAELEADIKAKADVLTDKSFSSKGLLSELAEHIYNDNRVSDSINYRKYGFYLVYQPIVELRTGRLCMIEVSARLQHPIRGKLLPIEFIPRMESSGEVTGLIKWMTQDCITSICRMRSNLDLDIPVSISIPQSCFIEHDFTEFLCTAIQKEGLTPRDVAVEISEACAVSENAQVEAALISLKQCGFFFIIGGYGTGFCNFARLIDFSPHTIKIDRSLIYRVLAGDRECAALAALIATGRNLDLITTADAVDNSAILEKVKELGFDRAQGAALGGSHTYDDFLSRVGYELI